MLAWLDLETTGLSCEKDKILEVACIITADSFEEKARFHAVTDAARHLHVADLAPEVIEMHMKNGLLMNSLTDKSCDSVSGVMRMLYGFISFQAAESIWKDDKGSQLVLAGSTVAFDRGFLEKNGDVGKLLHYHSLDVTSLNETAKRCWPEVYEGRPQGRKLHRAMPDIEDSIATARYYRYALKPSACVLKFRTAAGNLMYVGAYSRIDAEIHAAELRAGGAQDVSVEAVR